MEENGLICGGAGLDGRKLKGVEAKSYAEQLELYRIKRRLAETELLPHAGGVPRILADVSAHYGKDLLEKLGKSDAEYAADEMLLLPEIVGYVAFTERKPDAAQVVRLEADTLPLAAAYEPYRAYFEGKSRAERVWTLRRTLELSNYYNVTEREIAESAVNLAKFSGGGDVRYYLTDGVELTMKNALKRKSVPRFVPEREVRYRGKDRQVITAAGKFPQLADGLFRFFRENGAERGVIPSAMNLRAKSASRVTSPRETAALLFYCVTALDAGEDRGMLTACVSAVLEAVQRAEKWRGHMLAYLDVETLASTGMRYCASHDAALVVTALRLTAAACLECGEDNLARRANQLADGMDLTAFLDASLGRFSLGYYPDAKRFDTGHYRSQYGRGLLLHLLTNTSLENLEPIITNETAALETGLFYRMERYCLPRRAGEASPFWAFFLRNAFLGRDKRIEERLYACCNWGISESGTLEDLTFRPLSAARILLMCDREKVLARLNLSAEGFERPEYFQAVEDTPRPCRFLSPETGKEHAVCENDLTLSAEPDGSVTLSQGGKALLLPLLFLSGRPVREAVVKYRYLPDGAEYLLEENGVRARLRYALDGGFRLSAQLVACPDSPYLTVVLPADARNISWSFPGENADFSPEKLPSDKDLLLRTVGFSYGDYGASVRMNARNFSLTGDFAPGKHTEGAIEEARRNAPLRALTAPLLKCAQAFVPREGAVRVKNGYDAEGAPTLDFTGFGFEDFLWRVPYGKYLAAFSPLYVPDFGLLVYDDKTDALYAPFYYPSFADGDYSVTFLPRGAEYRCEAAGLSLRLSCREHGGGLMLRFTASNNLPEKRRLSLRAAASGQLSAYGGSVFSRELPLARYASATEEFYFDTGAGTSYDKPDSYRLAQPKSRALYFNSVLMAAAENLPRYLTSLNGCYSPRQAEAFALLLCHFDLRLARRLILDLAERQSIDGGFGDFASSALFPYCVAEYAKIAGDARILEEAAGYADSTVREEVKYHMMKCLDLEPANRKERLLYVFLLETLLDTGAGVDRYRLVRAAGKRRAELARSAAGSGDWLEDFALNRDFYPLYRLLDGKLQGKMLSFGEGVEGDTELALYLFLMLSEAYGIRRRGRAVLVTPRDDRLPGEVLKCRLSGGKLDVAYGADKYAVDGIEVNEAAPVPLAQGRRAVKISVR